VSNETLVFHLLLFIHRFIEKRRLKVKRLFLLANIKILKFLNILYTNKQDINMLI